MITRHKYKDLIWVDMLSPTNDELEEVRDELGLSRFTKYELSSPSLKPRVDNSNSSYLYLVLHFPVHTHKIQQPEQEVDFVIGKNFLLTVRYDDIHAFDTFYKALKTLPDEEAFLPINLFIALTQKMYKSVESNIDKVSDELEIIEKEIFRGHEKEMVRALSEVGRDILNLKHALDPHQDVWNSLEKVIVDFAGEEYKYKVRNLEDTYYRARKHITHLWQTLSELRETNNSLLSTNQNEVMKIFTILAFVTFPLSLIASIFGMNTKHIPIIGHNYDFWIVMFLMFLSTVMMYAYFKYKKWI